jgi:hypothetical protein
MVAVSLLRRFLCVSVLFAAVLEGKGGEIKVGRLDESWTDLEDGCNCSTRAGRRVPARVQA